MELDDVFADVDTPDGSSDDDTPERVVSTSLTINILTPCKKKGSNFFCFHFLGGSAAAARSAHPP